MTLEKIRALCRQAITDRDTPGELCRHHTKMRDWVTELSVLLNSTVSRLSQAETKLDMYRGALQRISQGIDPFAKKVAAEALQVGN